MMHGLCENLLFLSVEMTAIEGFARGSRVSSISVCICGSLISSIPDIARSHEKGGITAAFFYVNVKSA